MIPIHSAIEKERCRRSAHYFIFDSKYLKTKDEQDLDNSVKPVPDWPYLRVLLDCYLLGSRIIEPADALWALANELPIEFLQLLYDRSMLFVEKSRELFVTNLTCAFIHWRAKYLKYQLILVQSKNELDAANLVFNKEPDAARISFQEYNLPQTLKNINLGKASYCNLSSATGSRIRAIPEGGHVIRSEHPSMIFSDEGAFQPEFDASFTAAIGATKAGALFLSVSTAEPGVFQNIVCPDDTKMPSKICGSAVAMGCIG